MKALSLCDQLNVRFGTFVCNVFLDKGQLHRPATRPVFPHHDVFFSTTFLSIRQQPESVRETKKVKNQAIQGDRGRGREPLYPYRVVSQRDNTSLCCIRHSPAGVQKSVRVLHDCARRVPCKEDEVLCRCFVSRQAKDRQTTEE